MFIQLSLRSVLGEVSWMPTSAFTLWLLQYQTSQSFWKHPVSTSETEKGADNTSELLCN